MRAMKDSGIPWIGEIPEGWGIDTIGNLYTLRTEKVSDKDYAPLSVTKMGVVPQLETAAKTDDGDNRKLVRVGDFAINSRSDRRGSCGISPYDGSVSLINLVLTPRGQMYPRFYNWLFHTELFADEFYKWGHGIVDDLWTTRWQEMKRISIVSPSYQEQQRIAEFLDRKCGEVDEMIGLQEQIIEELKAYKQSVITEAVTKGLNPAAPMRDSGIEWIGSIPKHWEIAYLKRFCKVNSGREIEIELEQDSDNAVPVYGSGGVFKYTNKPQFNGEVVMFGRKGTLGKPIYANGRFWAVDTMYYLTFGNLLEARYCFYQLVAFNWEPYITQTALPSIVATDIVNTSFAFPSIAEQQAIADYLDDKCADIDALIATKQQKIDSLKEYKKSIIYEYVTGKREVNE